MPNFRETLPQRRLNRAECKHYSSYLKTLRADFHHRCGYCNDHDKIRIRSFTIDHFVPQNPDGFIHNIKNNYYYNLVYSCRYCNAAKSNKWPSKDAAIHHDANEGFIDPCNQDYTDLFKRENSGRIIANNPVNALSNYIIKELNLWQPIHERMWKLERIKVLSEEVNNKLKQLPNGDLKEFVKALHYEILTVLESVQSSIFIEND
ncbi:MULTISPECIES: HNH endonuclease [unclassified Sphingobacterium]|uniref:HNH endonuclease n=1 Tax=unclassified Sphingobacterium TaxID=2609468 RepID=UPI0020C47D98|nr:MULTISPECIES: HNH endonuclease [unclassified Sphingobacterium]